METDALIQEFIEVLENHKAVDTVVFDVRGKSTLADYYVFTSGNSSTHIRALANGLGKDLKDKLNILPRSTEGATGSQWILVDYADVLVHIFHPEVRSHYAIENLHRNNTIVYPGPDWVFPQQVEGDKEDTLGLKDKLPSFLE